MGGAGHAEGGPPNPDTRLAARAELGAVARRGISWSGLPESAEASRPAAVLILFGRLDGSPAHHTAPAVRSDLDVLLIERADTLTHHPGQVSFPGGGLDPDDTGPVEAALREAVEETGLDPSGVEVLGALDAIPLPVSGYLVTPVLAWWAEPSPVAVVDAAESTHVFRAPVADLLDPDNRRTVTVARAERTYRGPGFLLGRHVVWGFTAMVLDRLFDELGWTEPWDRSLRIPAP